MGIGPDASEHWAELNQTLAAVRISPSATEEMWGGGDGEEA
jgi:hypothetical protein